MFFLPATAFSNVTYQYTGNNFTNASSPFTTSYHISITMTLSAPLGVNQSNLDITANIVSISLSDGVDTITEPGNANFISAVVSTTPTGNIWAWSVKGQNAANDLELIWTTNINNDFVDEVNFGARTAAWVPNSSGTWVLTTPPGTVPTIVDLNPRFGAAGGPSFIFNVIGTGFLNGATIIFNGSPVTTYFTNSLAVYAEVPANLIMSPGSATVTVLNPDGAVSDPATFTIRTPVTITTSPQLPPGTVGTFYSQALSLSGGVAPYSWAVIAGALPPGLSFSNDSGTITGIPTSAGNLSFTVAVTDFLHASHTTQTFDLTISGGLTITTNPTLPSGNVGTFYSQTLTAGGGVTPYVWSLASGTLPGLSLSSSGTVAGTPTAEGIFNFTAKVTDASSATGTHPFNLTIGAAMGPSFVGSMPHIAAEENWTTTFTLVNKGTSMAQTRLSFFGDLADPSGNGPLTLPLFFPQQSSALAPVLNSVLNQNISANASLIVATSGPQAAPVLIGSAQLASTGAVDGFAIFHQIVTSQEAVVPMETRNVSSYLLAFDNTNGLVLGVAMENISAQNAVIGVVIRDETGTVIGAGPGFIPTPISLAGTGHTSFVLSTQYPITANKRGTIEFDTSAGGQISVLGLRFTPPNNALTTIPAFANVGTGGGNIAHLASGGDGWQTTFVLVNAGTSSAQATLNFFADQTGAPMPLPLTFPQGAIADTTAPSVTQNLLPGATLLIASGGASQLLTGSAQLNTTGNVSGFVIFRHNNQEAVVPLESRNANGYIIAFDNTNGTTTGVALSSVSTQQVDVPIVVRDDTGAQLAADVVPMASNGHYAFTLGSDRYPSAANIRGTIEFDTPANAQIGVLGIRIPAGSAHTYTTLPALAK